MLEPEKPIADEIVSVLIYESRCDSDEKIVVVDLRSGKRNHKESERVGDEIYTSRGKDTRYSNIR